MNNETQGKLASSHPYMDKLQENLATQRTMEILLQRKIEALNEIIEEIKNTLSNTAPVLSTEYSVTVKQTAHDRLLTTDYEIQKIKAQGELDVLRKVIREKDTYYRGYMEQFEKDIEEVGRRFKTMVDVAKKSTKPNIVKLINSINWQAVETDDEVKIAVYKQLKKHF